MMDNRPDVGSRCGKQPHCTASLAPLGRAIAQALE